MVNDAMNPDSSPLKNRDMFLLPPGQKHTYFSPSDTTNPHGAVCKTAVCLLGASLPRSLSLLPRAALVSFLGRGDD